jgi:hypothetical protein
MCLLVKMRRHVAVRLENRELPGGSIAISACYEKIESVLKEGPQERGGPGSLWMDKN